MNVLKTIIQIIINRYQKINIKLFHQKLSRISSRINIGTFYLELQYYIHLRPQFLTKFLGTSDEQRKYYLKKEIERAEEERKRKREENVKAQTERANKRTKTKSKAKQNKADVSVTRENLPNKTNKDWY